MEETDILKDFNNEFEHLMNEEIFRVISNLKKYKGSSDFKLEVLAKRAHLTNIKTAEIVTKLYQKYDDNVKNIFSLGPMLSFFYVKKTMDMFDDQMGEIYILKSDK